MSNLSLVFRLPNEDIDVIDVDAATVQTHEASAEITDHPVERGANIADHSRSKPDKLTIEGIISNTPINLIQQRRIIRAEGTGGTIQATTGTPLRGSEGRANAAESKLRELKEKGALIAVVTRLRSYQDMLIETLTVPMDAHTGDAIRFTLVLKRVRFVQNKVTPVKIRVARAKKQKLQKQPTKPANPLQGVADAIVDKSDRSGLIHIGQGDISGGSGHALNTILEPLGLGP